MMRWLTTLLLATGSLWIIVAPQHLFAAVEPASALNPLVDYRYVGRVERDANGRIARDPTVVAQFKRLYACPSTKRHSGACPGWAIDHPLPLDCGGVDAVYNMQWLPLAIKTAPGRNSKDNFERTVYGGHAMSAGCP